jgi:threonine synthase
MPYLQCQKCGRRYNNTFRLRCSCGGLLDVRYDSFSFEPENFLDVRRYLKMLPVKERYLPKIILPITPIMEYEIQGIRVFFKMEHLMPSGSFKDRGTYITISKLKEMGVKDIVLDSSGNAGISFSLFGKSEGINVHVFIPSYTSKGKKKMLKKLGAIVHEINGTRMETHEEAEHSNLGNMYPTGIIPISLKVQSSLPMKPMSKLERSITLLLLWAVEDYSRVSTEALRI